MMAWCFLKSDDQEWYGRLYNLSEKGFIALANGDERGVDIVLRDRFGTLLTFIGTVIAICPSVRRHTKDSFRSRTLASLYGTTEFGQDVSFWSIACSRRSGGS